MQCLPLENLRFKEWLDSQNRSASSIASNLGVSRAVLSHILSGRNKLSLSVVQSAARHYKDFDLYYVVLGEHWFKMAMASSKKLAAGNLSGSDAAFYDAKMKTADFYFENVFNRTESLVSQMNSPLKSVMALKPEHFSFN